MTNTTEPSPHYNDRTRRDMLMFVRDNAGQNGEALVALWRHVYGAGDPAIIGNRLSQFEREGLLEYVPVDGSHSSGLGLGSPVPHHWRLTDRGRDFLAAPGSPS